VSIVDAELAFYDTAG